MIAQPDPDSRRAQAASEPGPGRPWRLIDGGNRAMPDAVFAEAALHLLVEHSEQGVAVTDRSGRVHVLNRAARAFVGRGLLRLEHGYLRGATSEAGATLRRLLAGCAAGRGGSARLDGAGGTLLVAASAIPAAAGTAVLLRLVDPAQAPLPDTAALRDQFGFTPAEAALAVDILAGNDLATSAQRRGISRNTARAHLRYLFEKTGTRRQAELMRLLLLSPQPIADTAESEITSRGSISSPNGGCEYPITQRR